MTVKKIDLSDVGLLMALIFFYLGFISRALTTRSTAREGEAISLTPFYHFYPLDGHLDMSRAIAAESSPLSIEWSWEPLVSERKSLTTKLRTLEKKSMATLS